MGWWNRPLRLAGERAWLLERVGAQPDLTLRGVQAQLAARGIRVSCKAIWNFFRAERLTFKKSLHAAEQDWPDVARRRVQ